MDQFAERLAQLADLGEDELSQLEQEMVEAFNQADNDGDVDTMSSLADALDEVRTEAQRRSGDEGAEEPAEAPMPETMAASAETAEPIEVTDAAEPETTEPAVTEKTTKVSADGAVTITETVPAEQPEVVTEETELVADEAGETLPEVEAAVAETEPSIEGAPQEENMDEQLTASDAPEEAAVEPELVTAAAPPVVIRAGADIPGHSAGSELESFDDIAEIMATRINSLRGAGGDGEKVVVASISTTEQDDDRTLMRGDAEGNLRKVRALQAGGLEAITAAANGWCAPRTPIYNIFGVGSNERPVQSSLPGYNADRGGILWTAPPALADAAYGVGKWSWVTDAWKGSASVADGALSAKVMFTPDCPGELTSDLYAVTTQLKFDNMTNRAFPEFVRRNIELSQVAHARFAESILLGKMWSASSDISDEIPTPSLGALRDYLFTLRVTAVSMRHRHRAGLDAQVDVWAPAWLRDAIALDLNAQAPGDDTLDTSYGEIDGYLGAGNINVTWYLDDVPGAADSQLFTSNSAFPDSAATIMTLPGSFLYLDGGTLDLGVVRDGDLVGTNEYIEFSETFEGLAFVGVEALRFETPVNIIGGTAAAVDTSDGIALTGDVSA